MCELFDFLVFVNRRTRPFESSHATNDIKCELVSLRSKARISIRMSHRKDYPSGDCLRDLSDFCNSCAAGFVLSAAWEKAGADLWSPLCSPWPEEETRFHVLLAAGSLVCSVFVRVAEEERQDLSCQIRLWRSLEEIHIVGLVIAARSIREEQICVGQICCRGTEFWPDSSEKRTRSWWIRILLESLWSAKRKRTR